MEHDDHDHALVVPPIGIMQILHVGDDFSNGFGSLDTEAVMRDLYPTDIPYVTVRFDTADGGGTAGFFPSLTTVNRRAREALRILTGAHMVLTGPVIFTGVPAERLGEVVATLSVDD